MFEVQNIPQGMVVVKPEEITQLLQQSGSRGATLLFPGDIIRVGDVVASSTRKLNNREVTVYFIEAQINNQKPRFITLATFRQFPTNPEAFLAKSELLRLLYDGSDAERYEIIKGKIFKCTELFEAEGTDWRNSNPEIRDYKYKMKKFPVITYAD